MVPDLCACTYTQPAILVPPIWLVKNATQSASVDCLACTGRVNVDQKHVNKRYSGNPCQFTFGTATRYPRLSCGAHRLFGAARGPYAANLMLLDAQLLHAPPVFSVPPISAALVAHSSFVAPPSGADCRTLGPCPCTGSGLPRPCSPCPAS